MLVFNEAEANASEDIANPDAEPALESIVKEHARRRRGGKRKLDLSRLDVVRTDYELPEKVSASVQTVAGLCIQSAPNPVVS